MINTIEIIVLAGGCSRRSGKVNKLIQPLKGGLLIEHTLATISKVEGVSKSIVLGYEYDMLYPIISKFDVKVIRNTDYIKGIGRSIAKGVKSLDNTIKSVIIALADMPFISVDDYNLIITSSQESKKDTIIIPTYRKKRGHPRLFKQYYFTKLRNLRGDQGAKEIITLHEKSVIEVSSKNKYILKDFDRGTKYYNKINK